MPTTRLRHTITEDDALAVALEDAGRRWPDEEAVGARVLRLVEAGRGSAEERERQRDEEWQRIVRETAGSLTGSYEPGYLEKLREDRPE